MKLIAIGFIVLLLNCKHGGGKSALRDHSETADVRLEDKGLATSHGNNLTEIQESEISSYKISELAGKSRELAGILTASLNGAKYETASVFVKNEVTATKDLLMEISSGLTREVSRGIVDSDKPFLKSSIIAYGNRLLESLSRWSAVDSVHEENLSPCGRLEEDAWCDEISEKKSVWTLLSNGKRTLQEAQNDCAALNSNTPERGIWRLPLFDEFKGGVKGRISNEAKFRSQLALTAHFECSSGSSFSSLIKDTSLQWTDQNYREPGYRLGICWSNGHGAMLRYREKTYRASDRNTYTDVAKTVENVQLCIRD